jgi:hypothetical protein
MQQLSTPILRPRRIPTSRHRSSRYLGARADRNWYDTGFGRVMIIWQQLTRSIRKRTS